MSWNGAPRLCQAEKVSALTDTVLLKVYQTPSPSIQIQCDMKSLILSIYIFKESLLY